MMQTVANTGPENLTSPSIIAQILLHCATPHPGARVLYQVQSLLPKVQNWECLFERAQAHKLLPQLYQILQQVDSSLVEVALLDKLATYYVHHQKRSLLYAYEMVSVVARLAEQGIPAVVFKGPTLAQIAYGKLEYRSFTDLDFWVLKSDYFRVQNVLSQWQYRLWKDSEKSEAARNDFQLYAGEYTLFREQGNLFLDIHHRCLGGMNLAFSADFSVLWQRLETISIAGKPVQTFSQVDLLIYLCLNGTKDGWSSLRHILDIAAMIQNSPELNWGKVKQYAAELNVERIVILSLMLTETLTDVRPPSNFDLQTDQFNLRALANHLSYKIKQSLDEGRGISFLDEFWMRWRTCSSNSERMEYCFSPFRRLLKLLFEINSFDRQFLPLPNQLSFLYYFIRPLRVIQVYRKDILKILVK